MFNFLAPNSTSFWESKCIPNLSKIVLAAQGASKKPWGLHQAVKSSKSTSERLPRGLQAELQRPLREHLDYCGQAP